MPKVQEKVKEFFGREPRKDVNPDEAVAVGAGDHESGVTQDPDVAGFEDFGERRHRPGGDACETSGAARCPHFGPEQAQRLGDESVPEVAEHHIVTVRSEIAIEGERQLVAREPIGHAFRGSLPRPAQRRQSELANRLGRLQSRLSSEVERGGDDPLDPLGRQPELFDGCLELLMAAGQRLAQTPLHLEHLGAGLRTRLVDRCVVESGASTEQRVAHLIGQHRADRPEVVADLLNLECHSRQKTQLGRER